MNEVIKQLYDRKSVRAFTDDPIDEAIVQEILCSSAMAPTAGNQQMYTIIREVDEGLLRTQIQLGLCTRDKPLRKRISQAVQRIARIRAHLTSGGLKCKLNLLTI